ncbi:hypothetical protein BGW39_003578, partial [Mortierella sp. 14UC]
GYILKQERPECLQPMAQDGSFPWKEKREVGPSTSSTSTGTTSTATTTSDETTGRHERGPTHSSPDQQQRGKSSRT